MASIDRLPREVLLQIFRYVPNKKSRMNCISVCKKWQESATEATYKEVTLKAFQMNKIKALFKEKLLNYDNYLNQLQWTKKLTIEYIEVIYIKSPSIYSQNSEGSAEEELQHMTDKTTGCKLEQEEFLTLISYLPKLQEMDVKDSTYMVFLQNPDCTKSLKRIKRIRSEIPDIGDQDQHFATYYNFRDTLTHVVLVYPREKTLTLDGQTGDALLFLGHFGCLIHLELFNDYRHKSI